MSKDNVEYTVLSPIKVVIGKTARRCEVGQVISLADDDAAELLARGAIRKGNHRVANDTSLPAAPEGAELAEARAAIDMLTADVAERDRIITELQARVDGLEKAAAPAAKTAKKDKK